MPHAAADIYDRAFRLADRYLLQSSDAFARSIGEDIAAQAAVEVVQQIGEIRRPAKFNSYVCTISRRLRARALKRSRHWRHWSSLHCVREIAETEGAIYTKVHDDWHERSAVFAAMDAAVTALGGLNASLIRGYYEGFSCRELGERFGLEADVVKVRIHRSRRRIQRGVLSRLRADRARTP